MIIRKATIDDISGIFSLVKDLAAYENASDQVTIDEDYYKESFNNGLFESLVAEHDGEILGTCIYYRTFSTWKGKMLYLEDFVVKEEFRQAGIGQKLYNHLLQVAQSENYTMVKWQVLDWNEPAIKFYEKNNATIDKEWWNCKVIF